MMAKPQLLSHGGLLSTLYLLSEVSMLWHCRASESQATGF